MEKMTFLYTARETFDKTYDGDRMSWDEYIEWSKLTDLNELVSLDRMLNKILVEPDYDNADDWNYIHMKGEYETGLFTSLNYVLSKTKPKDKFNLLMVVIEPSINCKDIKVDGYDFIGYDLLDQEFGFDISLLTNCGGYNETFLPSDLNDKGLIDDFVKAYDIKKRLLKNNPECSHADGNIIAVWRHQTIGCQTKNNYDEERKPNRPPHLASSRAGDAPNKTFCYLCMAASMKWLGKMLCLLQASSR